jgi:hypothetical protein
MRVLHKPDQKIERIMVDALPGLAPEHRKEDSQQNQRMQKAPEKTQNRALILKLELSQRELVKQIEIFFSSHKNARPRRIVTPSIAH